MHQKSIFLTTTILLALNISSCGGEQPVFQKLKIVVTVDETIKNDQVYIAGNAKYLGEWDAGKIKLDRLNDSQWVKTFDVVKGEKIRFKFTAGDWWREATDRSGLPFQDYPLVPQGDTTINLKLHGWLNDFSGDTLKLSATRFSPGRRSVDLNFSGKFNPEDNPKWAFPEWMTEAGRGQIQCFCLTVLKQEGGRVPAGSDLISSSTPPFMEKLLVCPCFNSGQAMFTIMEG